MSPLFISTLLELMNHIPAMGWAHLLALTDIIIGDIKIMIAARQQLRQGFEKHRSLSPGSEEFTKEIKHAEEVAKILRQNVVQGECEGRDDHYSMSLSL